MMMLISGKVQVARGEIGGEACQMDLVVIQEVNINRILPVFMNITSKAHAGITRGWKNNLYSVYSGFVMSGPNGY
jgi:hypothetical protein